MKKTNPQHAWLLCGALAALACASEPSPGELHERSDPSAVPVALPSAALDVPEDANIAMGEGVIYVGGANPERPHLRYLDGQVSRNESCFIKLGNKLNAKVPPLYINGNPVGFC